MKRFLIMACIVLFFCGAAAGDELIYSQEGFSLAQGSSVAVAPFQNLTGSPAAGNRLAGIVEQVLRQVGTMRIVGRDQFTTVMNDSGLSHDLPVDRSIAQKIGQQLGVNYVVFGSVVEYGYELAPDGKKTLPIVGLDVRILNVGSGSIVFAGSFSKEGSNGGRIDDVAMGAATAFYDRVSQ